jgi:hypothetical protein
VTQKYRNGIKTDPSSLPSRHVKTNHQEARWISTRVKCPERATKDTRSQRTVTQVLKMMLPFDSLFDAPATQGLEISISNVRYVLHTSIPSLHNTPVQKWLCLSSPTTRVLNLSSTSSYRVIWHGPMPWRHRAHRSDASNTG